MAVGKLVEGPEVMGLRVVYGLGSEARRLQQRFSEPGPALDLLAERVLHHESCFDFRIRTLQRVFPSTRWQRLKLLNVARSKPAFDLHRGGVGSLQARQCVHQALVWLATSMSGWQRNKKS